MDVRESVKLLVKQAVEAYLENRIGHAEPNAPAFKPSITILFNNQTANPDEVLKAVTAIEAAFLPTFVVSEHWAPLLNGKEVLVLEETSNQTLQSLLEKTDLLIVPVASFGFVSKLALMMDDDKAVQTAVGFQLLGKPVILAKNAVELGVYQQVLAPHSVQEKLQGYIRTIQKEGIKWVALDQLTKVAKDEHARLKEKQPLILAKHIEKASNERRKEIIVPKNSKISPVAKDLARELKVRIQKEN